MHGPGAQHNFARRLHTQRGAAAKVVHGHGTPARELHARGQRIGVHREVGAAHRRAQVGARGAHAQPTPHRDLVQAQALGAGAVEAGVARQAELIARAQPGPAKRVHLGRYIAHVQRPLVAAMRVMQRIMQQAVQRARQKGPGRRRKTLHAAKAAQRIAPTPARVALGGPALVIRRLPAHIDHGVDGARATEHLAARPVAAPAIERGLGLGEEPPVQPRVVEREAVADGHLHPRAPLAAAGFQQQHAVAAVLREPVGEHAASGAGADDDVVVGGHGVEVATGARGGGRAAWTSWRSTRG